MYQKRKYRHILPVLLSLDVLSVYFFFRNLPSVRLPIPISPTRINPTHTIGLSVSPVFGTSCGLGVFVGAGVAVGPAFGDSVGFAVGSPVGFTVGSSVGFTVGPSTGLSEGVGSAEGFGCSVVGAGGSSSP